MNKFVPRIEIPADSQLWLDDMRISIERNLQHYVTEERLAATEERLAATEERLAATEERLAATEERLAATDGAIDRLESRVLELLRNLRNSRII